MSWREWNIKHHEYLKEYVRLREDLNWNSAPDSRLTESAGFVPCDVFREFDLIQTCRELVAHLKVSEYNESALRSQLWLANQLLELRSNLIQQTGSEESYLDADLAEIMLLGADISSLSGSFESLVNRDIRDPANISRSRMERIITQHERILARKRSEVHELLNIQENERRKRAQLNLTATAVKEVVAQHRAESIAYRASEQEAQQVQQRNMKEARRKMYTQSGAEDRNKQREANFLNKRRKISTKRKKSAPTVKMEPDVDSQQVPIVESPVQKRSSSIDAIWRRLKEFNSRSLLTRE